MEITSIASLFAHIGFEHLCPPRLCVSSALYPWRVDGRIVFFVHIFAVIEERYNGSVHLGYLKGIKYEVKLPDGSMLLTRTIDMPKVEVETMNEGGN